MNRWMALLGVLVGCGDQTPSASDGPAIPVDSVGPKTERQLDVLFVIGDSPTMQNQQPYLIASYAKMIAALEAGPGLPNLHIGVVSTDLGTKGAEDVAPGPAIGAGPGGCSGEGKAGLLLGSSSVDGNFIIDVKDTDGSRTTNYTGTLAEAFTALASVGTNGCEFQQPLEAMKRALSPNSSNAGFLRPMAKLAVVFILAEDDCSLSHSTLLGPASSALGPLDLFRCTRFGIKCDIGGTTDAQMASTNPKAGCHPDDASLHLAVVSSYVDFLKTLKADPDGLIVSSIVGGIDPFVVGADVNGPFRLFDQCQFVGLDLTTADDSSARPAVRMDAYLAAFEDHASHTTICQADVSGAMTAIKAAIDGP